MTASKTQVGGGHYKDLPIQPAEFNYRNGLNSNAANIVKYASRAGKKGGRDGMQADIRKIIHYAELWLEYEGFTDAPIPAVPAGPADGPAPGLVCGLYIDRTVACPTCEED
jgi:hypothetical protein